MFVSSTHNLSRARRSEKSNIAWKNLTPSSHLSTHKNSKNREKESVREKKKIRGMSLLTPDAKTRDIGWFWSAFSERYYRNLLRSRNSVHVRFVNEEEEGEMRIESFRAILIWEGRRFLGRVLWSTEMRLSVLDQWKSWSSVGSILTSSSQKLSAVSSRAEGCQWAGRPGGDVRARPSTYAGQALAGQSPWRACTTFVQYSPGFILKGPRWQ